MLWLRLCSVRQHPKSTRSIRTARRLLGDAKFCRREVSFPCFSAQALVIWPPRGGVCPGGKEQKSWNLYTQHFGLNKLTKLTDCSISLHSPELAHQPCRAHRSRRPHTRVELLWMSTYWNRGGVFTGVFSAVDVSGRFSVRSWTSSCGIRHRFMRPVTRAGGVFGTKRDGKND